MCNDQKNGEYEKGSNFKNVMITGGAGFIGSAMVNFLVEKNFNVVVVDKLNYCSRKGNWDYPDKIKFYQTDVSNKFYIFKILESNNIEAVIHFAAQTHVDNSFNNVEDFVKDNISATQCFLDTIVSYKKIKKFIHVSTDEVYGENGDSTHVFYESDKMCPTNPYAATKAATEHVVNSYSKSYNVPIIITRGNNVYGPGQYPEKVIPKFIMQCLAGKSITLQGGGLAKRTFVFVKDLCEAFFLILNDGVIGEVYNLGSEDEISICDLAKKISEKIIKDFKTLEIPDRNFNDNRYLISSEKIRLLGWKASKNFDQGLDETIEWYRQRYEEFKGLID